MPPANTARRDRLSDAAIELLAREGARGLTHRGVDAEAGEPPGTTSRYFRTRDALMRGVVDRARALHFADLARVPAGPVDESAIAGHLAGLVRAALTDRRSRHLAMAELFLESTRRPELRTALTETRQAQVQLISDVFRAAGVELSGPRAALLVATITGLFLIAVTTPEAIGLATGDSVDELVREAVRAARSSRC